MAAPHWRQHGRFWRYHPTQTAEATASFAYSIPCINGIFIPDVTPIEGEDFLDSLGPPSLGALGRAENLMHEFFHIRIGTSATGQLLRAMTCSLLLVLHHLGEGLTLRVPSWQIEGRPDLTAILQKLMSLFQEINEQASVVDEAICSALTLYHFHLFELDGLLSESQHAALADNVRANLQDTMPDVWEITERLRPYMSRPHGKDLYYALMDIVIDYCFGLSPAIVQEWWDTGHVAAGDGPLRRLDFVVDQLDRIWDDDPFETVRQLALVTKKGPVLSVRDGMLISVQNGRYPRPFSVVAAALGLRSDDALFQTAIGRAYSSLLVGPPTPVRARLLRRAYNEEPRIPIGEARDLAVPLLLLTHEADAYRCRYAVNWQFGKFMVDLLTGRLSLDTAIDRIGRGEAFKGAEGRWRVRRASTDTAVLWDTYQILEQLLETDSVQCLCGSECDPGSGCACGGLLARVHEHTRTDAGGQLPPLSCRLGR